MKRWIAHVDMDCFFVAVERLKDPSLNGIPVAVGGRGMRSVISSASYEARKFGVRSAQPVAQAIRLCPKLKVVSPDFSSYSRFSKQVMEILRKFTPLVEVASVDEAYLDLSGFQSLYGEPDYYPQLIRHRVFEGTRLQCTVGLSPNKLVSKIASDFAKPNGGIVIPEEEVLDFLAPLSLAKLPGVGTKTWAMLQHLGFQTCSDLRKVDPQMLTPHFSRGQIEDWVRKVFGVDDRPVKVAQDRAVSIGREETFDVDCTSVNQLTPLIHQFCLQIAEEIREEECLAGGVEIKLRTPDFVTSTRSKMLDVPTVRALELAQVARDLLFKNWTSGMRLRLFGISVKRLIPAHDHLSQMSLFDQEHQGERLEKLEHLKDQLKNRFGKKIFPFG